MRNKNQILVNFKSKFLVKLIKMKNNGLKLEMMEKLKDWIEDNIDEFYEN